MPYELPYKIIGRILVTKLKSGSIIEVFKDSKAWLGLVVKNKGTKYGSKCKCYLDVAFIYDDKFTIEIISYNKTAECNLTNLKICYIQGNAPK